MKVIINVTLLIFSIFSFAQENTGEKVKVNKKKDGSSVYNFNFYIDKDKTDKKNEKNKKKENTKDDLVVYKKKKPKKIKKGNGIEAGIFVLGHLGDIGSASDLDLGSGLKIGFIMMNSSSGFYFTPGVFVMDAGADYDGLDGNFLARRYGGSAFGGHLKVGKLNDRGSKFSIDAGIEGSYMSGDLDSESIFGDGSYKFSVASVQAYGGPVFKVGNFLLSGLLGLGIGHVKVDESIADSRASITTTDFSEKKMLPLLGLSLNATFVF